jgi:ABC-type glycerol-3-phosphate transport system permease component
MHLGVRAKTIITRVIIYTVIIVGAFVLMIPFFWMLSTSLKDEGAVWLFPPRWIPKPIVWENYKTAFTMWPFGLYLLNSVKLVVINITGILFSCSMVAFSFSRLRWPGRDFFFLLLISTMMIPGQVTMIPIFVLFRYFGWIDTFYPLTVPSFFGSPFFIFLLRQFFLTIPREMEEAAKIDGCSTFQIFSRILLPLSKPALGTVAIFTFMGVWNDFMGPLIYINSESRRTATLALGFFRSAWYGGTHTAVLMASSMIVMLPCLLLFFFAQRYYIQGIVITGLKG